MNGQMGASGWNEKILGETQRNLFGQSDLGMHTSNMKEMNFESPALALEGGKKKRSKDSLKA